MLANATLFRTSTFRLAAIYLLFFALSTAALLGYVYYNTVGLLERQTESTIKAEILTLADQYADRGIAGVAETVARRSQDGADSIYLLQGPDGSKIAGDDVNVAIADSPDQSWFDFPVMVKVGDANVQHMARAFHVELAGEYELIIGRDVEDLRQFRDIIRTALFWALGFSLAIGLGGGVFMSRNFLKRIEAINTTTHQIVAGNFSGRMPISGSGDELDRLSISLNNMLSQIEKLIQGMKEVSSNVAHDLRSPLTRLRARIEDALRSNTKASYQEALQQTLTESDSLLATFNALLSIAQAESGHSRSELEILDAYDIIADVADLYEPLLEENGGELKLLAKPNLMVRASRQLLAQVLNNLIDNAVKYGADEGSNAVHLTLEGHVVGGQVVVSLADRGPGIPEKDRVRVLQRFVRLDVSRTKPGNGLGLSLVASVVNLLGGELLLADNKPGLKIVLRLPLASPVA